MSPEKNDEHRPLSILQVYRAEVEEHASKICNALRALVSR